MRKALIRLLVAFGVTDAAPTLLAYARDGDDFERLDALDALARLGVDEAEPVARALLRTTRTPSAKGVSHGKTVGELARLSLEASPSAKLRALASEGA